MWILSFWSPNHTIGGAAAASYFACRPVSGTAKCLDAISLCQLKNMDHYQLQPAALPTWGQRISLRLLHLAGWRVRFKPLPGPHGVARAARRCRPAVDLNSCRFAFQER
jgi:hypothetical protein